MRLHHPRHLGAGAAAQRRWCSRSACTTWRCDGRTTSGATSSHPPRGDGNPMPVWATSDPGRATSSSAPRGVSTTSQQRLDVHREGHGRDARHAVWRLWRRDLGHGHLPPVTPSVPTTASSIAPGPGWSGTDTLVAQTLNSVWCGDGPASGEVYAAGDSGVFLVRKGRYVEQQARPFPAGLWAAGDDYTPSARLARCWTAQQGRYVEAGGDGPDQRASVCRLGQHARQPDDGLRRRQQRHHPAAHWPAQGRFRPASPATRCRASGPEAHRKFMPSAAMAWCCVSGAPDSGTWAQVAQGIVTAR